MPGYGSYGMYDRVDLVPLSESVPRNRKTTTLQIHHAAGTSDAAVHAAMQPGGRTLSAQAILERDGTLVEKVAWNRKAHTSGSVTGFDHESFTVEVVNQTGGPQWGISERQRVRLARWAQDLKRLGLINSFNRGVGGIIGHSETPGAYPTACPGPDMHLDHIARLAAGSDLAGNGYEEIDMPLTDEDVQKIWTWMLGNSATGVRGRAADWLTNLPEQMKASVNEARGDIAKVDTNVTAVRADVNYIHQESPYSLKAIREAQSKGQPVSLTDEQVQALSESLVSGVIENLELALEENQTAVLEAISQLPDAVRENIKAAL